MAHPYYYTLDENRQPVAMAGPVEDPEAYAKTWSGSFRRVGSSHLCGFHVSTVFIPIDMNYTGTGDPILWETMIFDNREDVPDEMRYEEQFQYRYSTEADAKLGHELAVTLVRERLSKGLPPG